jgi:hypothetical protein
MGCLLFPCVAKGRRYYDEPIVESSLVQASRGEGTAGVESGWLPLSSQPPGNMWAGVLT